MYPINAELIASDEIFKAVIINNETFENYYISNYGRLYSLHRNRILKPWMTDGKRRYCQYSLYRDGKSTNVYAHRLVAYAFLENSNPDMLKQVNHKDEDPSNNNWKNLEWCTRSYNQNYGTASQRKRKKVGIPIKQLDLDLNVIATYDSIRYASILLGISDTPIHKGVRDGLPHKGYYWEYIMPRAIA